MTSVIARSMDKSHATWQSPGTMFDFAVQYDGWYREIPTGLKALGMTRQVESL